MTTKRIAKLAQTSAPAPSPSKDVATRDLGYPLDWTIGDPRAGVTRSVLYGTTALRTFAKMADEDETIGSMIWLIESTLGQLKWKHIPQKDGVDAPDDDKAKKWAAFADTLLTDMRETWPEHISEAVSMVIFGHAPCEIILKQRDGVNSKFNDYYYGVESLPRRDPASIMRWVYNDYPHNLDLAGFEQSAMAGAAFVPAWKTVNYRVRGSVSMPMGRSMLANAVRSWKLKVRIQNSEALGIDRELCGLPIFRLPEADMDTAAGKGDDGKPTPAALAAQGRINNAIRSVSSMRLDEQAGVLLPSDTFAEDGEGDKTPKYNLSILTSAGQRSIDTRTAIRDYDRAISRVILMQFLHLGDRSSGSYGLSDDQSSLAMNSLGYLADNIAKPYTEFVLGLVWRINMLPEKYRPRLGYERISKDGLAAIGQYMRGLGSMQWMLEHDPKARVAALALAGVTSDTEGQAYVEPPAPTPTFGAAKPAATQDSSK